MEDVTSRKPEISSEDRAVLVEFGADPAFLHIRQARSSQSSEVAKLRESFKEFVRGDRVLSLTSPEILRASLLRLLQLRDSMESELTKMPEKYAVVRRKILEDYGVSAETAYMAKVNDWLKVVFDNQSCPTS